MIYTIGEKIRELRLERNLTQFQLAQKIKVNKSALSFWELNQNEPTASYITALANYFNVTTDYLLGIEEMNYINSGNNNVITGNGININSSFKNSNNTNTNLSDEEQQIINDFRKLSKDKQAAIKLLLK